MTQESLSSSQLYMLLFTDGLRLLLVQMCWAILYVFFKYTVNLNDLCSSFTGSKKTASIWKWQESHRYQKLPIYVRVAVAMPDHHVVLALLEQVGRPLKIDSLTNLITPYCTFESFTFFSLDLQTPAEQAKVRMQLVLQAAGKVLICFSLLSGPECFKDRTNIPLDDMLCWGGAKPV